MPRRRDFDPDEHPRWPRGTPGATGDEPGPGPGRFRDRSGGGFFGSGLFSGLLGRGNLTPGAQEAWARTASDRLATQQATEREQYNNRILELAARQIRENDADGFHDQHLRDLHAAAVAATTPGQTDPTAGDREIEALRGKLRGSYPYHAGAEMPDRPPATPEGRAIVDGLDALDDRDLRDLAIEYDIPAARGGEATVLEYGDPGFRAAAINQLRQAGAGASGGTVPPPSGGEQTHRAEALLMMYNIPDLAGFEIQDRQGNWVTPIDVERDLNDIRFDLPGDEPIYMGYDDQVLVRWPNQTPPPAPAVTPPPTGTDLSGDEVFPGTDTTGRPPGTPADWADFRERVNAASQTLYDNATAGLDYDEIHDRDSGIPQLRDLIDEFIDATENPHDLESQDSAAVDLFQELRDWDAADRMWLPVRYPEYQVDGSYDPSSYPDDQPDDHEYPDIVLGGELPYRTHTLGDLIRRATEASRGSYLNPPDGEARDAIETRIREMVELRDPDTGMHIKSNFISFDGHGGMSVEGYVLDRDGNQMTYVNTYGDRGIARWKLTFKTNYLGEVLVEQDLLVLPAETQGNGMAARWAKQLEMQYRENKIDAVTVHADIDVGGYAWAKAGFDFLDSNTAKQFLTTLARHMIKSQSGGGARFMTHTYTDRDGGTHVLTQDTMREVEELLRRSNNGEHITPLEIALLGWAQRDQDGFQGWTTRDGRPTDMWLGKSFLLGSNWYGKAQLT